MKFGKETVQNDKSVLNRHVLNPIRSPSDFLPSRTYNFGAALLCIGEYSQNIVNTVCQKQFLLGVMILP